MAEPTQQELEALALDKLRKYQIVFETKEGAEILADICRAANVASHGFVVGDSHLTAFNEGRRSLALYILRMISVDENKILDKVRERLR